MDSKEHQNGGISPVLQEHLHRREELCKELEALALGRNCDYPAEIERISKAYAEAPELPLEFSELLDKRFAEAKNAAVAGEALAAQRREKGLQLLKALDALAAAGELATAQEAESLAKRFAAYSSEGADLPSELADFTAKLEPIRARLAAEAQVLADRAAAANAICDEFAALCDGEEIAPLHDRKEEFEKKIGDLGELAAPERKRWQELFRKASARLARHYETLDFARWESYTLKLDLCAELEKLMALPPVEIFKAAKPLVSIREKWKTLGSVPREKNEEINARYLELTRALQHRVDESFSLRRQEQKQAQEEKQKLVEEAVKLADSTHWNDGAAAFRELQAKWKALPLCGAKEKELFAAFRAPADKFFTARSEYFAKRDAQSKSAAEAKEALIARAETLTDVRSAKALREEFRAIPGAGKQEHELYQRFNAAMDKFFDALKSAGAEKEAKSRALIAELDTLAAAPAGAGARVAEIREELHKLACRSTFSEERKALERFDKAMAAGRRAEAGRKFDNYRLVSLKLAAVLSGSEGAEMPVDAELEGFAKLKQGAALLAGDDPDKAAKLEKYTRTAAADFNRALEELESLTAAPAPAASLAAELEAAILGNFAKSEAKAVTKKIDPDKARNEILACGFFALADMEEAFRRFDAAYEACRKANAQGK